jgi:hypothetical protein
VLPEQDVQRGIGHLQNDGKDFVVRDKDAGRTWASAGRQSLLAG